MYWFWGITNLSTKFPRRILGGHPLLRTGSPPKLPKSEMTITLDSKPSGNDEPKTPLNLITSTFFLKKDDFVECSNPQLSGGWVFPTFWALPPKKWSTKTTPEDLEPENTPQRKIETDHHLQVLYLRGWSQVKKVANVKWIVYLCFPWKQKLGLKKKHEPFLDLLLMEEIRLTSWFGKHSIIYRVFVHPRWLGRGFLPLTVSLIRSLDPPAAVTGIWLQSTASTTKDQGRRSVFLDQEKPMEKIQRNRCKLGKNTMGKYKEMKIHH